MIEVLIEKLSRDHALDEFDCGDEALNRFLFRFALSNQLANASQTYVGLADGVVIAFFSLAVGEIAYSDAPERRVKGLSRHPVPVMLLARLAVDQRWRGKGVGAGMLKDAVRRTSQAADIAGIRAFVAHAKNEAASRFYQRFGFIPSTTDPLHVYLLIKDIRRLEDRI